jgi:O-methyltransferase involved in polyketide biosynthesis
VNSPSEPDPLEALTGVPRTTLWTLYCRAVHAERGQLVDPEAVRILRRLEHDPRREFGRAEPSFAARARWFDAQLRAFLDQYPDSDVVSLGEGLETQRFRLADAPYRRWITVDLPSAIRVRERFITPDARHSHRAEDVRTGAWLDEVASPRCAVVAQGLCMYLAPAEVQQLVARVIDRGSGGLWFDVVPRWVSRLSRTRAFVTPRFRVPRMPWGVGRPALASLIRSWAPHPVEVEVVSLPLPRGPLPWTLYTAAAAVRF